MKKLHYYESQSYLIKREQRIPNYVPDKADIIDVSDITNFKVMINDIRPYEVFYRVYFFTDKLISDIAYAIACDCEITLAVDSLNSIATFEVFDEVEPATYKTYPQAKKNALFAYVNEQLQTSGIPAENEYSCLKLFLTISFNVSKSYLSLNSLKIYEVVHSFCKKL